jgi:putative transposase
LPHLLKAAGLAKSTFYYWLAQMQVDDKYQPLKESIKEIFHRHKGRYGYRRVTAALRQAGQVVNHKTVQRLMGMLDLKSLVRPKKYQSYKGETGKAAPDRLKRQFKAKKPNQKWVTDVTEFSIAGEKLYLSPVMDLYNGEIVAFEAGKRPSFELVGTMLHRALDLLKPWERPILHSDQGWQYRMPAYQLALKKRQLRQSMSRKGNCHDNAAMESFFAVLKSELFHGKRFSSIEQFKQELTEYIRYYNYDRIKMKLGGLSPVQYRTRASLLSF